MRGSIRAVSAPPSIVLAYHAIDDEGSVLSVPPVAFERQMRLLAEMGAHVVPLHELWQKRQHRDTAEARVAITFDDGFLSVYEHAFPVLERHDFPATIFLVSDYCSKRNDWPGQPSFVQRRLLMTWGQAREMSRHGISFECHTRTHPNLTLLPTSAVEEELVGSKQTIEDALGAPVSALAYPYGAHDAEVRRITSRWFELACTTRLAFVDPRGDSLALSRVDMYYVRSPMLFRRLLSRQMRAYLAVRRAIRDLRAKAWAPPWEAAQPVQVR